MAVTAAVRENVRPPRISRERGRERGVVRTHLGFKADEATRIYIENEAKHPGWTVTTVLHDMVTTQIDVEKMLGQEWVKIEAQAVLEQTSKGKVLAGLVLAGLKARKK